MLAKTIKKRPTAVIVYECRYLQILRVGHLLTRLTKRKKIVLLHLF